MPRLPPALSMSLSLVLLACGAASAGEAPAPTPAPAPDPAALQAALEAMSRTGPEHAALRRLVGEWTVATRMIMGPGAEERGTARATIAEILDGRWLRQDFQGTLQGKPFAGQLISGYDTIGKRHVGVWVDNVSTAMTVMTGASGDGGSTITYRSRLEHCPVTGGPLEQRFVIQVESADRFTMRGYHTPQGGTESLAMENVYTRWTGAKEGGAREPGAKEGGAKEAGRR